MKALAVVTAIFLPGTFVATVFSMPLLDWKIAKSIILSNAAVYWTVTIPVTLVTILTYVVWSFCYSRRGESKATSLIKIFDQVSGEPESRVLSLQRENSFSDV
jgi:hypothetical protein